MSALPIRIADPFATWPDDYCCDACCSVEPELFDIDGDHLCRTCADRVSPGDECGVSASYEPILSVSHPAMREYAAKLDAGNRRFTRFERRQAGRA